MYVLASLCLRGLILDLLAPPLLTLTIAQDILGTDLLDIIFTFEIVYGVCLPHLQINLIPLAYMTDQGVNQKASSGTGQQGQ